VCVCVSSAVAGSDNIENILAVAGVILSVAAAVAAVAVTVKMYCWCCEC